MSVPLQCPNPACAKVSLAPDGFVGRSVRCRGCGRSFVAGPTISPDAADTHPTGTATDPFPNLPAPFGRYRVLKLLGRGGMGSVYLADDTELQRQVALKLPSFDAGETRRVERFVREARAAAGLMHPNICPVYDVGQINGRPFIAMGYIAGVPLETAIDPDAPMDPRRAAETARKIAVALHEAHEKGIVHRDLKPANVMLNAKGEPVVMDFGLAKKVAEVDPNEAKLTRDGAVMGTPSYMAPEQVRADQEQIGPATDVYALGVMLFEMLTGRTPYSGSIGVVLGQILAAPVPPLGEFRTDADPRLAAVCATAMEKAIGDRFASMSAFAAALDEYLRAADAPFAETVEHAEPSAAEPVTPRRRWPLAVGAAVVLAGIAGGFMALRPKPAAVEPTEEQPVAVETAVAVPQINGPAPVSAVPTAPAAPSATPDVGGLTKLFSFEFRDPATKLDGQPLPRGDGGAFMLRHQGPEAWGRPTKGFGSVTPEFVVRAVVRMPVAVRAEFDLILASDDAMTQIKLDGKGIHIQQLETKKFGEIASNSPGAGDRLRPPGEANELVLVGRGRRAEVFLNRGPAWPAFELPREFGKAAVQLAVARPTPADAPPTVLVESLAAWSLAPTAPAPPPGTPPRPPPSATVAGTVIATTAARKLFADAKFDEAVPLLAAGNDAWADAAKRDAAKPTAAAESRAAGDAWWQLAAKLNGREQTAAKIRAAEWYAVGLTDMAGPERAELLDRVVRFRGEPPGFARTPSAVLDFTDPASVGTKSDSYGFADGYTFRITPPNRNTTTVPVSIKRPTDTTPFVAEAVVRLGPGSVGVLKVNVYNTATGSVSALLEPSKVVLTVAEGKNEKETVTVPTGLFNPPGEWNRVSLAVWPTGAELYVNGGFVGRLTTKVALSRWPFFAVSFMNRSPDKAAKLEFDRYAFWDADALPVFADGRPLLLDGKVPRLGARATDDQIAVLAALKADPNDPAANFARGKHIAVSEDRWEVALAYLLKGNDAAWKAAAKAEQLAGQSVEAQRSAADGWWKLAEAQKGRDQYRLRRHAADLYRKALPDEPAAAKDTRADRIRAIYGPPDPGKAKLANWVVFSRATEVSRAGAPTLDGGAAAVRTNDGMVVTAPAGSVSTTKPLLKLPADFLVEVKARPTIVRSSDYLGMVLSAPDLSTTVVRFAGPPQRGFGRTPEGSLVDYDRAPLRFTANLEAGRKHFSLLPQPLVRVAPAGLDTYTAVVKGGQIECYLNGVLIRTEPARTDRRLTIPKPAAEYGLSLLFESGSPTQSTYLIESMKVWPLGKLQLFAERDEEASR